MRLFIFMLSVAVLLHTDRDPLSYKAWITYHLALLQKKFA